MRLLVARVLAGLSEEEAEEIEKRVKSRVRRSVLIREPEFFVEYGLAPCDCEIVDGKKIDGHHLN